jgi:tRNA (adenine37-N6)-methyltransferase
MNPDNSEATPLRLHPVGVIRTPYLTAAGTPIQTAYGRGVEGEVIVEEAFEPALADIEGFERLWLIYWLHRADPFRSRVLPYRDTREHGLFATRAPCRPHPIGMSVVRLLGREGRTLRVADLDILDGTPLLDIKPYIPEYDAFVRSAAGWFDELRSDRQLADRRFHPHQDTDESKE